MGIGQCLSRGTLISMFLVMFVLPQILVLGDRIVEKTSFHVKLPAAPIVSQRLSGTTFVNGRVRGRNLRLCGRGDSRRGQGRYFRHHVLRQLPAAGRHPGATPGAAPAGAEEPSAPAEPADSAKAGEEASVK